MKQMKIKPNKFILYFKLTFVACAFITYFSQALAQNPDYLQSWLNSTVPHYAHDFTRPSSVTSTRTVAAYAPPRRPPSVASNAAIPFSAQQPHRLGQGIAIHGHPQHHPIPRYWAHAGVPLESIHQFLPQQLQSPPTIARGWYEPNVWNQLRRQPPMPAYFREQNASWDDWPPVGFAQ